MSAVLPRDDWDRHWERYDESAQRNPAQWLRRRIILRLLKVEGSAARIVDIGSGQGELVSELRAAYPQAELLGLEFSRTGVDIATERVPAARFVQRDLLRDQAPRDDLRGWASHATCSEVLEHVDDPRLLLTHAAAYLAPGCRLVVTVPGGPMSAFDRYIGHRGHFSPHRLRRVLHDAGFEVEFVTGVGFPFFNLYRLVVILRGRRLIADVAQGEGASSSTLARLMMGVFKLLFRFNVPRSGWGWQIVAAARWRPAQAVGATGPDG